MLWWYHATDIQCINFICVCWHSWMIFQHREIMAIAVSCADWTCCHHCCKHEGTIKYRKPDASSGISYQEMVTHTKGMSIGIAWLILKEYKLSCAEIIVHEDIITNIAQTWKKWYPLTIISLIRMKSTCYTIMPIFELTMQICSYSFATKKGFFFFFKEATVSIQ